METNKIREERLKQEVRGELDDYRKLEIEQTLQLLSYYDSNIDFQDIVLDVMEDEKFLEELNLRFEKIDCLFEKRSEDHFFEEMEKRRQKRFR